LEKIYKKSGIKIMTSTEVTSVDTKGKGCKVTVKDKKGAESVIECDIVLSAVGVVSNVENIGLEDVGILVDRGKIKTDEYYRTNMPGYYAIGDVTFQDLLWHTWHLRKVLFASKKSPATIPSLWTTTISPAVLIVFRKLPQSVILKQKQKKPAMR
jgi:dihydrolipoamide dehydrogenase